MKAFGAVILCALQTVFGAALPALPLQKTDLSILRRQTRSVDGNIGCIHMESFPGELHYVSDGTKEVCGLYIIGQPNQLIEIAFLEFNVNCETGGILALFDGWELQGELFPSVYDHAHDMTERYTMFCGEQNPTVFVSSQNVALIQFKIPQPGEGFKVIVNFRRNPQPCNAVAMFETGMLTMRNYGLRRNCSTSIIYPEQIHLVNVDVGVTSQSRPIEAELGLSNQQCMNIAGGDYIQVMNGNGLDPSMMTTRGVVCGMDSNSEVNARYVLGCQHSAVRMVSSGEFHNTVTFQYAPPQAEELQTSEIC